MQYIYFSEAKGTGFEKIEKEYREADLKHKPYIFSRQNSFSIVLPDLTYEDGIDITSEMISLSKPILNESKYDNLIWVISKLFQIFIKNEPIHQN